jgi:glycosyltransferase involved in cell wall biosynthesis
MSYPPYFSIIVPTYNRLSMLLKALKSISSQTFRDLEVIIINDGSSENYHLDLDSFDFKIKYISNEHRMGVSSARNRGVSQASGEWIVFLDDDDEFFFRYLEILHQEIRKSAHVGIFWCGVEVIDRQRKDFCRIIQFKSTYPTNSLLIKAVLSIGASYGLAIQRKNFILFGYFNEGFKVGEDTELLVRMLYYGVSAKGIDTIGIRKYEDHQTRLANRFQTYSKEMIYEKILHAHKEFFSKNSFNYASMLRWAIAVHLANRNFKHTFPLFRKILCAGHPALVLKAVRTYVLFFLGSDVLC